MPNLYRESTVVLEAHTSGADMLPESQRLRETWSRQVCVDAVVRLFAAVGPFLYIPPRCEI